MGHANIQTSKRGDKMKFTHVTWEDLFEMYMERDH